MYKVQRDRYIHPQEEILVSSYGMQRNRLNGNHQTSIVNKATRSGYLLNANFVLIMSKEGGWVVDDRPSSILVGSRISTPSSLSPSSAMDNTNPREVRPL